VDAAEAGPSGAVERALTLARQQERDECNRDRARQQAADEQLVAALPGVAVAAGPRRGN
jgi:hypothetical protein